MCVVLGAVAASAAAAIPQEDRGTAFGSETTASRRGGGMTRFSASAAETAVVVYDLWDAHWCGPASGRAGVLAGRVDAALRRWRRAGLGLVAFAPNGALPSALHPARRRAARCVLDQEGAPRLGPPLEHAPWELPVASDPLRSCEAPAGTARKVWSRQHPSIDVEVGRGSPDVFTTSPSELACLLRTRNITRLLLVGVHANVCMLWLHPLSLAWLLPNRAALGLTSLAIVSDLSDSITDGGRGKPPDAHAQVLTWINATLGVPHVHSTGFGPPLSQE